MRKFKGSPGPWDIENNLEGFKCIWSKSGARICTMNHNDSEPKEANAQLIAAAPELLEALQELSDHFCGFTPLEIEAFENANRAINKALGK